MGNDFDRVLRGIRGDNPEHTERLRKEAEKRRRVEKAAADNKRRRKQKPRTGSGNDVIDSGMFD